MKTKQLVIFAYLFVFATFSLQANPIKQSRKVSSFTKISVSSGINIFFTQDGDRKVEVEAISEIQDEIIVEIKGGALHIGKSKKLQDDPKFRKEKVNVFVSAPVLEGLNASSGSTFNCKRLECKNEFDTNASSGACIEINELTVVKTVNVNVSSGAGCKFSNLSTNGGSLKASSGGNIDVDLQVAQSISVNSSSGANINVSGAAQQVKAAASSGGNIDLRKLKAQDVDRKKSSGGSISI